MDSELGTIITTLWSLLTLDKCLFLQLLRTDGSSHDNEQKNLAEVAKAVRSYIEGTSGEACAARGLLAQAGRKILKKKSTTEKALGIKISRSMWSKVCSKVN